MPEMPAEKALLGIIILWPVVPCVEAALPLSSIPASRLVIGLDLMFTVDREIRKQIKLRQVSSEQIQMDSSQTTMKSYPPLPSPLLLSLGIPGIPGLSWFFWSHFPPPLRPKILSIDIHHSWWCNQPPQGCKGWHSDNIGRVTKMLWDGKVKNPYTHRANTFNYLQIHIIPNISKYLVTPCVHHIVHPPIYVLRQYVHGI